MTNFVKDQFNYHGGYLTYFMDPMPCAWDRRKFVARFKYASTSSKGAWITFLIKNFTVEEYFGRLEAGETPLAVMESKGFLLSHIKKLLKERGYPVTKAGFDQYIKDDIAKRYPEAA